jgi:hypothetical protein
MLVWAAVPALLFPMPAVSEEVRSQVERSVRLSGVADQVDRIGAAILAAVPTEVLADRKDWIRANAMLRDSTSKEKLLPVVYEALESDFIRADNDKVIEFYESKVGRKVSRLVGRSLDAGAVKEANEGRDILNSLDEPRRRALERIVDAEKVVEFNRRLLICVARGLVEGRGKAAAEDAQRSEEAKQKLKAVEKRIGSGVQSTADLALVASANAFRPLTDSELDQLAEFLESDEAAWFRAAVQRGLEGAVFRVGVALGDALHRLSRAPADE